MQVEAMGLLFMASLVYTTLASLDSKYEHWRKYVEINRRNLSVNFVFLENKFPFKRMNYELFLFEICHVIENN